MKIAYNPYEFDNVLQYLYLDVQILNMGYDYVEDNYEHFIFFTA